MKNDIICGACKFLESNSDNAHNSQSNDITTTTTMQNIGGIQTTETTTDNDTETTDMPQTLSSVTNTLSLVELCSLIAQAELRNYNPDTNDVISPYDLLIPANKRDDENFLKALERAHSHLHDVSRAAAESRFLRVAAAMPSYGVEYHAVKNAEGQPFNLGVGPEGISVYDLDWQMTRR